jgi:mRNA interferase HigB
MTKKTVDGYCTSYKEASTQLQAWYYEVKNAQWNNPLEVKAKYRTASIIGGTRVVFNIKGNKYRLVTKVNYQMKVVFILFFGTHKEYNKINVEEL